MALVGKTVVFVGMGFSQRAEITVLACKAGARVKSSVRRSTDILIAGPDASASHDKEKKVAEAGAMGATVWSITEFKKAVGAVEARSPAAKAKARGRAPPAATACAKPISEKDQHAFADLAKTRKFDKVISLIKENPGYINVQPAGRWSALHQAAEAGNDEAVKFLVAKGANLEAKTKDGKTPEDVAKASVKELLRAPPKRKASESGGVAKRATSSGVGPTLHLFNPMSAFDLQEDMGCWFVGDNIGMCREDVRHRAMGDAPAPTREIANRLRDALGEATLPAGESDVEGRVIVISQPGEDSKCACLKALAIKERIDEDIPNLWSKAHVEDVDFSEVSKFCAEDEDDDEEDDGGEGDSSKIKAATVVMQELKDCFKFNFEESVVTAPVVWGGYSADGSIVGVLGMRVWT